MVRLPIQQKKRRKGRKGKAEKRKKQPVEILSGLQKFPLYVAWQCM